METLAMLVTAAGSAVAGVLIAFRRREDTSIKELRDRVTDLTTRVEQLEDERDEAHRDLEAERREHLATRREVYRLKRVLVEHGIDEVTA